jgi:hypothetical protein
LLITLSKPHYLFPHGGYPYESFALENLPAQYRVLEGRQWTPAEVPGRPDQVILYNRFQSLSALKASGGISGAVSFSSGEFIDYQASTRITAAIAMMVRRPGDNIFVTAGPATRPGNLDPHSPDNWFAWPELLGAPRGEYVIDNSEGGVRVLHMYRDFENGRIEIFPLDDFVRVQLWNRSAAADPIVLAAAVWDEAADLTTTPAATPAPLAESLQFAGSPAKPLSPVLTDLSASDHRPDAGPARAADRALLELSALDLLALESLIDEITP